jgi:hypothetical protein
MLFGLPEFENVDAIGVDRVGGHDEVQTARSLSRANHHVLEALHHLVSSLG